MENTTLQAIIDAKRDRLEQRKASTPLDAMRALAGMQKRPPPLLSTVTDDGHVMLFGQIRYGVAYDPVTLALSYAQAGLDAITLFTDDLVYDGGFNDLALITRALPVPVLMQNYLFDEYQIVEARAAGAASLTLVAHLMDAATLRALVSATQRNRMSATVRVSNSEELHHALEVCPSVIDIGGRDPVSGTLDVKHIEMLRAQVPASFRVLIHNRLRTLEEAAAIAPLKPDGVLISPRLLEQDDALPKLREIFAP